MGVWHDLDVDALTYRNQCDFDTRKKDTSLALFIFAVVAVSLILQEYLGGESCFSDIVRFIDNPSNAKTSPILFGLVGWMAPKDGSLFSYLTKRGYYELGFLLYWASWRIIGFLFIPLLAVALHPRLRKVPLGLSFRGMSEHLWIYLVLFLPVLVAVFIASFFEEFSSYYPFYSLAHRSLFDFAIWEIFYVVQFLALEFFFRGFMIQPLRRSMGTLPIFAMMIPYVMIHFGKPMMECFGAIIAGIVLGTLALRTRSIWSGFLIHVSVALSMDLLAIWQVHWR